jgi:predicted RNA-binding Zn-ribbon protein involved in translation (DUF1610 family)
MRLQACPHCGKFGTLHRSRSRNFKERLVKFFLPYKIYRCSECGWRGYIYIGLTEKFFGKTKGRKKIAKWKIYFFVILILILVRLTYRYFDKIGAKLAPIVKEILQRGE